MIFKKMKKYGSLLRKYPLSKENAIDAMVFEIVIPIFLFTVFFTPLNQVFALHASNPTLSTIYFSNFAHADANHLINNLTLYLISIYLILVLVLAFKVRSRKEFYFDMAIIYLLIPFIISLYNIYLHPSHSTTAVFIGFSGIVAALIGYFVSLLFVLMYTKTGLKLSNLVFMACAVISINLILLTILRYRAGFEEILTLTFLTFLCLMVVKKDIVHISSFVSSTLKSSLQHKNLYFLYLLLFFGILFPTVMISLILWFSLFPDDLITDAGNNVNIYAHYIGYYLGILVPWIVYLIRSISKRWDLWLS